MVIYTNLTYEDEEGLDAYDALVSSGLLDKIIEMIGVDYGDMVAMFEETLSARISFTTSSSNTARSTGITLRQAQAEIKRNMKTIGTLQEQYVSGIIDESTYKQSKRTIGHRNSQLARQIQNQGTASDWVTSASDIRGAQAKNQEAYKAMTQSASEFIINIR